MITARDLARLRAQGLLARDETVASVIERFGVPGSGDPTRVLSAEIAGAVRADVLPGRGFDVGHTSVRGVPISWVSPVADARPIDSPQGDWWLDRFTGGLIVTCGLDSIGPATTSAGLHGDLSHRPAGNVRVLPSRGEPTVTLEADIEVNSLFGRCFRVERSLTLSEDCRGRAVVSLTDEVVNTGNVPGVVAMLYHVNFGAPVVLPGSAMLVSAASTQQRDGVPCDWRIVPPPSELAEEKVFLHRDVAIGDDGLAHARISGGPVEVDLAWSAKTLPFLQQWLLPQRGKWAFAFEPSTVPLFGEGSDAPPVLRPGDRRTQHLRIAIAVRS